MFRSVESESSMDQDEVRGMWSGVEIFIELNLANHKSDLWFFYAIFTEFLDILDHAPSTTHFQENFELLTKYKTWQWGRLIVPITISRFTRVVHQNVGSQAGHTRPNHVFTMIIIDTHLSHYTWDGVWEGGRETIYIIGYIPYPRSKSIFFSFFNLPSIALRVPKLNFRFEENREYRGKLSCVATQI